MGFARSALNSLDQAYELFTQVAQTERARASKVLVCLFSTFLYLSSQTFLSPHLRVCGIERTPRWMSTSHTHGMVRSARSASQRRTRCSGASRTRSSPPSEVKRGWCRPSHSRHRPPVDPFPAHSPQVLQRRGPRRPPEHLLSPPRRCTLPKTSSRRCQADTRRQTSTANRQRWFCMGQMTWHRCSNTLNSSSTSKSKCMHNTRIRSPSPSNRCIYKRHGQILLL